MAENLKPFLCATIEKPLIRSEWEKWLRSFQIYIDSEEITSSLKKRNKLLHIGGPQLQEVAYSIPGAIEDFDEKKNNDVFKILVEKLNNHFTPKRNSVFERHIFRSINVIEGETFNQFILRLRQQMAKCIFGSTKCEIENICLIDKIIDEWAPLDLKRKLLEKEYDLDEIIQLCQVDEQIKKQSQSMQPTSNLDSVNKINLHKNSRANVTVECGRCGRKDHDDKSLNCPAKNQKCNKCNRFGHFARKCRTNLKRHYPSGKQWDVKRKRTDIHNVDNLSNSTDKTEDKCFKISSDHERDETILCHIAGRPISMIIDSGSKFNLLSTKDWVKLQENKSALFNIRSKSNNNFRAYASDKLLRVICVFEAPIYISHMPEKIATFYVIENGRQSLLGKDTAIKLNVLRLGLNVNKVEELAPFPKWKNIVVKLAIDTNVTPVQQPVRRIPVALEEKVILKLEDGVKADIIEPVVGPSRWISPIVLAFKENGDIRMCIDMRRANRAILRENYPLPTFETFMTKLKGAKYFTRLDLKNAYHQIELHEDSREITTFITPRGLFRYKRLLFGVNSAPEIFQRLLEEMLSPCPNAMNYIDDVIIFAQTEEQHDIVVKEVLKIFRENNVLLNNDKCIWKTNKLTFLGHILSSEGIEADPEKVETIMGFRDPKNKEELRSFLGLVTYVGKFIPDLANHTDPLRRLLKTDVKFNWTSDMKNSFDYLKQLLAKIPKLSYFDPTKSTRLIADASPVALGAVLLQFDGNNPQIISFASKSLSDVEKRYSQTEKESLALVWSVEKYYYYLAGLEFELVTDHKPLEAIFKPTSKPPARIERWLLRLQAFKFKVVYKAGKENIADSLSRLCRVNNPSSFDWKGDQNILHVVSMSTPSALSITEISDKSCMDEDIVDAVMCLNKNSWTDATTNCFFPFRYELSYLGNILLRGSKIVIPTALRSKVLELSHEGHPGESVMKRRLRSKVWWPLIDREAEKYVKSCKDCLLVSQPTPPPPMDRHPFPEGPWLTLASDLLGPLPNGQYVLVFIDYFSRYMEFKLIRTISSQVIINSMREIFCRLGYPKCIRTDNGRQYISSEFNQYCKENDIQQILTPAYWPQANGEVENMNKSIVKRLKIAHMNGLNLLEELQKFVHMYNVTPHSITGEAPTKLMFNRIIRDKIPSIDDLKDIPVESAEKDQDCLLKHKGKMRSDKRRGAKESNIDVGDKVVLKNVVFPHKLTPNFDTTEYEVTARNGNIVEIKNNGKVIRRNVSHLKKVPSVSENKQSSSDFNVLPHSSTNTLVLSDPTSASQESNGSSGPQTLKLHLKNIGGMWRPA